VKNLSERDSQVLFHPFTVFNAEGRNIPVVGGEQEFIITEDGRRIIDAVSSWWLNLHGHNHPYINQKVKEQLDRLEHVIFAGFTHEPAIVLAERLLEKAGDKFKRVFLSDNGSTAVEVALKMAIQHAFNQGSERKSVIAFKNSYHGDTFGSMSVSERDLFVAPFAQHLFSVDFIDIPTEENGEQILADFEKLLQQKPAAFIFEPLVQGAGGMRMYSAAWLDKLIALAQKHGVICIADEVMTGFGRTGTFFASDQLKNKPDLICLSKGITGGYLPLGATLISEEISKSFETSDDKKAFYHGHSFTGNPISCSAALASLDLMESEDSEKDRQRISDTFSLWKTEFQSLSFAKDMRTMGGIFAMDIQTKDGGYFYTNPIKKVLYTHFLERDILMRPMGNVMYIMPPYCTSDESLERIKKAIQEIPV
jgi:adenosylmethionine-8-amino-7-oxononanoate aminotransferase